MNPEQTESPVQKYSIPARATGMSHRRLGSCNQHRILLDCQSSQTAPSGTRHVGRWWCCFDQMAPSCTLRSDSLTAGSGQSRTLWERERKHSKKQFKSCTCALTLWCACACLPQSLACAAVWWNRAGAGLRALCAVVSAHSPLAPLAQRTFCAASIRRGCAATKSLRVCTGGFAGCLTAAKIAHRTKVCCRRQARSGS